jgi:hypothetical protein
VRAAGEEVGKSSMHPIANICTIVDFSSCPEQLALNTLNCHSLGLNSGMQASQTLVILLVSADP